MSTLLVLVAACGPSPARIARIDEVVLTRTAIAVAQDAFASTAAETASPRVSDEDRSPPDAFEEPFPQPFPEPLSEHGQRRGVDVPQEPGPRDEPSEPSLARTETSLPGALDTPNSALAGNVIDLDFGLRISVTGQHWAIVEAILALRAATTPVIESPALDRRLPSRTAPVPAMDMRPYGNGFLTEPSPMMRDPFGDPFAPSTSPMAPFSTTPFSMDPFGMPP